MLFRLAFETNSTESRADYFKTSILSNILIVAEAIATVPSKQTTKKITQETEEENK